MNVLKEIKKTPPKFPCLLLKTYNIKQIVCKYELNYGCKKCLDNKYSKSPAEINELVAVVGWGGAGDIHGISLQRKTFFTSFTYDGFLVQATSMVFLYGNFFMSFTYVRFLVQCAGDIHGISLWEKKHSLCLLHMSGFLCCGIIQHSLCIKLSHLFD